MERLDFDNATRYNSIEASIHLCRYLNAKAYCEGKKVLDVACGEGYGSYLIKKWGASKVVGVDCSNEAVRKANKYFKQANVEYMVADACKLPFDDDTFDLVVSFETIEHVDDDKTFLKEIKRVAKKDAIIIVSCPNDPYYYKDDEKGNPFHKRRYSSYDFKKVSQEVLGDNVHWSYGYALNGFMSIDESECTNPESFDISKRTMLDLLNYTDCKECYKVYADRYLNNWNANYYVGMWNIDIYMPLPAVTFPRETFIESDDPIFADINEWRDMYYEKLSLLSEFIKTTNTENENKKNNCELELMIEKMLQSNERLELEIKSIGEKKNGDDEIRILQEGISSKESEIKELKEGLADKENEIRILKEKLIESQNALNWEMKKLSAEKMKTKRTEGLLELADFEKQSLWNRIDELNRSQDVMNQKQDELNKKQEELEITVAEFERYKKSHSYKIMQPVRKIYDALKK